MTEDIKVTSTITTTVTESTEPVKTIETALELESELPKEGYDPDWVDVRPTIPVKLQRRYGPARMTIQECLINAGTHPHEYMFHIESSTFHANGTVPTLQMAKSACLALLRVAGLNTGMASW